MAGDDGLGLGVALDQQLIVREYSAVGLGPLRGIRTVPGALHLGADGGGVHWHHAGLDHPRQGHFLGHLGPAATALMLGKAMHTLVMVPAMISCLRPVAFTAATNSGLSQALISPLRATYCACGAASWISGINGPLGPWGTEAVVMTGIFARLATLARVMALARSSVMGMSLTVWNRPLWWSISSIATLSGSMRGTWPSKLAACEKLLIVLSSWCENWPSWPLRSGRAPHIHSGDYESRQRRLNEATVSRRAVEYARAACGQAGDRPNGREERCGPVGPWVNPQSCAGGTMMKRLPQSPIRWIGNFQQRYLVDNLVGYLVGQSIGSRFPELII
ncbi:hypothetical protein WR25_20535 [Diploscapter pachys]|uniref:Uncharacterized protein n=1 Tax=Diploscapter pachys TaxID=2018661 RepID=A0A2A2M3B3_9BILA|nr:hypothetical protein WR25_20535 [Diploscapter pachys]